MPAVYIISSIVLGAFAQILLKLGTLKVDSQDILKLFTNLYVFGGLALYGLSALLWILAISKVQLSFAYPMVSLGYVLVFALSYWIFDEPISLRRAVGLLVIIIGVVIISKSK